MSQQQQQAPKVNPSLADLDNPPAPPIPGAEEGKKPEEQKPPVDPIVTLQNEEKKPEEVEKKEPGTEDNEGTEEEDNDDPLVFYSEVEKLRGDGFKFEFPEGVAPDSPQGIHHAITAATEHGIEQWEQSLMKEDPRGYAYLLHRSKGGTDEEFFSQKTEVLPEWDVLKNSVDLQQAFYRRVLTRREVEPDQIDGILKDAIEKNKLTGLVEKEYNRTKKQDEDQLKEMLRISQENRAREDALISRMGVTLQEKILQNKGLGITIPDAKRSEFLQYFTSMVHFDGPSGRFFINQELNQDNINSFIEALYYLKVGGNLSEIIKNKASEQNTRRLKLNMQKDKTKINSKTNPNQQSNKPGVFPTLSEVG
jgi:hypothetical protein